MVHADTAGVAEQGPQHVAVGRVRRVGEGIGRPRRLRPVLSQLVVHVRRAADRHARGEHILQCPGIGTFEPHSDREIVDDPRAHAHLERRLLRPLHLLVQEPLHPQMALDAIGARGAPLRYFDGVGSA